MYTLGMEIEEKGKEEHLSSSAHDSCLSLTPGYPDALINSAELLIRKVCSFCRRDAGSRHRMLIITPYSSFLNQMSFLFFISRIFINNVQQEIRLELHKKTSRNNSQTKIMGSHCFVLSSCTKPLETRLKQNGVSHTKLTLSCSSDLPREIWIGGRTVKFSNRPVSTGETVTFPLP